jgi:hypothetical protein
MEIRGAVQYDGKPVPAGSVMFLPGTDVVHPKAMQNSCPIHNGEFHLPKNFGVAAGTYNVFVTGLDSEPETDNSGVIDDEKPQKHKESKQLFAEYSFVHTFGTENKPLNIIVPKK